MVTQTAQNKGHTPPQLTENTHHTPAEQWPGKSVTKDDNINPNRPRTKIQKQQALRVRI